MKVACVSIDILHPVLTSLYDCGCEIMKVFTCKTDNITEFNTKTVAFAKEHDIPLQMDRITKDDLYDLVALGCDFVLVGGYYYVIPVIDELRIVNTHPAYLPIGRGAWPMPLTILKGLTESGITMHRMTKGLDEGEIILREKIPVYADDDLLTLTERQNALIPPMVKKLVFDFDNLWDSAVPQDDSIAEYWEMPEKDQYTVKDTDSYDKVDLILRAFYSYECYYIDTTTGQEYELIGAVAKPGVPKDESSPNIFSVKGGYISAPKVRCI